MAADVLRYAAFTVGGQGGNPAGVVLDATDLDEAEMQRIAADVGFSETAFLRPRPDERNVYDVRYFAPSREVPFCGHATIAAAVALTERARVAELIFHTPAGFVSVSTADDGGVLTAELTSVAPHSHPAEPELVRRALAALHWSADELDPHHPPVVAYAGANHLVLVTQTRERLARLDYDFEPMAELMQEHDLTTLLLVWPESKRRFHARNPFAAGGVVEDPATGAAAAAFGGYLRETGRIGTHASFSIRQGEDMGRPSEIAVSVIEGEPGVRVRGAATLMPAADAGAPVTS